DYTAAQARADREALATSGRDLHYWQKRRASAELVPPPCDNTTAHFGSKHRSRVMTAVARPGRLSARMKRTPARGTLSYMSPVAKALAGRKIGDLVTAGNSEAEIVAIE